MIINLTFNFIKRIYILNISRFWRSFMECDCGGVLIEGKTSYRVSKKNFTFIFDNIPAYKCTRCDKVLFDEERADKIQKLVNKIEKETREIVSGEPSTNLYDY